MEPTQASLNQMQLPQPPTQMEAIPRNQPLGRLVGSS